MCYESMCPLNTQCVWELSVLDFVLFVPQIERVTGRKIVDLFDWIIGTSTGALIALCLTYGTCANLYTQ